MKERFINVFRVTRKLGFIMATVMLLPYLTSLPAVMASSEDSTVQDHEISMVDLQNEYEQYEIRSSEFEIWENYITLDESGMFIVDSSFEYYEESKTYLDGINERVQLKELEVDEKLNIVDVEKESFFSVQVDRNRNASYRKWWGTKTYASNNVANEMVYVYNQVAAGSVAAATISAAFTLGLGAVFFGLSSGYYWSLANAIDHKNSQYTTRGVIINITWVAAYTVYTQ